MIQRTILLLTLTITITSCIPTKIAPRIKDDKVMLAKKFKRKLPRDYAFIFKDQKDANEFYNYINTKFQLNDINVEYNVPIIIDEKNYYLSFLETEKETKTVNLVPIVVDAKLEQDGNPPILKDAHITRIGTWYILITVIDSNLKDCLSPKYQERDIIINYLKNLRLEYLNTHNYQELLFKKKKS